MTEYTYALDIRLRDVDFMGHVNNAVYATYLEEARERFYEEVAGVSLAEISTVLASMTIDYERPIERGETVTISIGVASVGKSSVRMDYVVDTPDGVAATAETVQVFVDPETGSSTPIPEEFREQFRTMVADG